MSSINSLYSLKTASSLLLLNHPFTFGWQWVIYVVAKVVSSNDEMRSIPFHPYYRVEAKKLLGKRNKNAQRRNLECRLVTSFLLYSVSLIPKPLLSFEQSISTTTIRT